MIKKEIEKQLYKIHDIINEYKQNFKSLTLEELESVLNHLRVLKNLSISINTDLDKICFEIKKILNYVP